MGVRNSLQSLKTLSTWWGAHSAAPFWNTRFAWEQSALWELWKRSGFATSLRVLQDTRTHRCMRTMDNDDWAGITPVIHIADGASGKKLSKRARLAPPIENAQGIRFSSRHAQQIRKQQST